MTAICDPVVSVQFSEIILRHIHFPHPLYEALPALYALAGLLTILMLPSALGWLSGLLLIATGWQVWRMRWAYRHPHAGRPLPASSLHTRPKQQGIHRHVRSPRF